MDFSHENLTMTMGIENVWTDNVAATVMWIISVPQTGYQIMDHILISTS